MDLQHSRTCVQGGKETITIGTNNTGEDPYRYYANLTKAFPVSFSNVSPTAFAMAADGIWFNAASVRGVDAGNLWIGAGSATGNHDTPVWWIAFGK